ncbi:MAG: hypothetical protein JWN08_1299 [Frankiales bacterium]|nr:hypothetical protein [Frankiales bacterium]
MSSWDDVRRLALALPGTSEKITGDGTAQWRVGTVLFVWERPLRTSDLAALGDAAPTGPVLAARVPDVSAKEALLADGGSALFSTPHFDGYPIVLAQLDLVDDALLEELVVEAWRCRAGKRLLAAFDDQA